MDDSIVSRARHNFATRTADPNGIMISPAIEIIVDNDFEINQISSIARKNRFHDRFASV